MKKMLKDSARNPPSAAVRAPRAKPGTAADGPTRCSSVLAGLGRGTGNPVWHYSAGLCPTQEKHHCLSHGKSTSLCTSPIFIPVRQGNGQENPSYKQLPSKGAHKQCSCPLSASCCDQLWLQQSTPEPVVPQVWAHPQAPSRSRSLPCTVPRWFSNTSLGAAWRKDWKESKPQHLPRGIPRCATMK